MKIGFIFAGQGAQCVGMGKAFYDHFEAARTVYDRANLALGYSVQDLCFNGPQEKLNETEITQPAILTTSIAMLRAFQSQLKIKPDAVCGLSLGEYSAHVCAGSLVFEDAVKMVRLRGKYMQEAVPLGVGGMLALVSADVETTKAIVHEASAHGIVEICNYNSPKQIVIGGELKALEHAAVIAKEKGVKRAMPLPVSAPFHTSMLRPAEEQLRALFNHSRFHNMDVPVISNVDGRIVSSTESIPESLAKQVTSSVKWIDCIESMYHMGIDTLVEFGPGQALSSFVAKINKDINVFSIYDVESLKQTISALSDLINTEKAV